MTSRELLYVKTIAEAKTISKAAQKLFVAQPSLSQSLQRIEDALGTQLFNRTASGLTLTDALELSARNMKNIYYEEAVRSVRAMVTQGTPLNTALTDTGLFPPMVCNMTGIGEESGDLQDMMEKVADYYDEEVQDATQKLLALMEPAIILFMAVFVIIIVLSIFLPMLSMTHAYDQYL